MLAQRERSGHPATGRMIHRVHGDYWMIAVRLEADHGEKGQLLFIGTE